MNGQDYLHAAGRVETAKGVDPWTALMQVFVARLQGMDVPAPLQPALDQAASHWSGGAGALLSKHIVRADVVAYEDLGTEAIRRLEVVDFPAVVAYDAAGGCVYDRVRDKSGAL